MARTPRVPNAQGNPAKLRRGLGNREHSNPADRAAAVARKERRSRVVALTLQGMTYRQIGAELGVDESTARKDFVDYLRESPPSSRVEEVRAVSDTRLERVYERLDVAARVVQQRVLALKKDKDGRDVYAEDLSSQLDGFRSLARTSAVLVSNIESRRRLHGADAPEEKTVRHSGPDGGPIPVDVSKVSHAELLGRLSRLAAAAGARADRGEPDGGGGG